MIQVPPVRSPLIDAIDALDPAELSLRNSEKWNTFAPDILAAWVAEMDFPLAEPVRAVLQTALDTDDLGYPLAPNASGIREAFAERMSEQFDWAIGPSRVEVLSEVVQGLYIAIDAFTPNDAGVIVQTPVYPPFLKSVRELGRELVECPFVAGSESFEFDFDRIDAAFAGGAKTLLLCNPQNPTGRVNTPGELERIAELVLAHDGIVISDEIHSDLIYGNGCHIPIASLSPEIAERTITLNSASKAFNLPGLRCAVAHFGSAQLQRTFTQHVPRHVRGGLGLLGIAATIAAWQEGRDWLFQIVEVLDDNRHNLARMLDERFPELTHTMPEGTYMTWVDCSALDIKGSPAAFFRNEGRVALTDGRSFGTGYDRHVRINFATSGAILEEIVERMAGALGR